MAGGFAIEGCQGKRSVSIGSRGDVGQTEASETVESVVVDGRGRDDGDASEEPKEV